MGDEDLARWQTVAQGNAGRRMSWNPTTFPEVIAGLTDAHPFELSGEELSQVCA